MDVGSPFSFLIYFLAQYFTLDIVISLVTNFLSL